MSILQQKKDRRETVHNCTRIQNPFSRFRNCKSDYYNLFNIDCCSVCHRRKKRIDKVEKYFRRTSLALFIFSLLMPAFIMGSCGLFYKNIFEVFVPLLFVFALLSLMLSYIIKRYWEYLLKYMKQDTLYMIISIKKGCN